LNVLRVDIIECVTSRHYWTCYK